VKNPGRQYFAGRLMYIAVKGILAGGVTLFCQLPCGRWLTYPDVRVEMKEAPWGDLVPQLTMLRAAFVPKAGEKEWPRSGIYGGLLFENAVQGTAASLLRGAVNECYLQDIPVVMHIHDELVVEGAGYSKQLHRIMNTAPAWADGLPLAAEVEIMERFGK
jgi:DNA polymerase